jgi:MFS family permease
VSRLRGAMRTTFVALEVRNFRLFFSGQMLSVVGSWMQMIAQTWLVLELTGNGAMLGVTLAMQWLPLLVIGAWAGVLSERSDKRKLMLVCETSAGLLALVLGLLVVTDVVEFWMVLVIAALLGVTQAIEQPARQTIVHELVGPERLTNGLSLTMMATNFGRIVGPAIAGVVIAAWGVSFCFLINALTYVPAVVSLLLISASGLHRTPPVRRAKGQFVEGLRYARSTPALWVPLAVMLAVGTLTYEFQVTLPLLASTSLGVDAAGYGLMQTALGVGAIFGAMWSARRSVPTNRVVTGSAMVFGTVVLCLSLAPTYAVALMVIPLQGATNLVFSTLINSSVQLSAAPEMRSRVMALFTMAWVGTTPIGAPLVGWIAQAWSPRWALALGGSTAIVAGALAWHRLRHEPDPSTTTFEHRAVPTSAASEGAGGTEGGGAPADLRRAVP